MHSDGFGDVCIYGGSEQGVPETTSPHHVQKFAVMGLAR